MRLITRDDILDILAKSRQRGIRFLLSKLTFNQLARTKSAFDESSILHSNWWIIPAVKERWNALITGDPKQTYEKFMMDHYFQNCKNIRLISIGSGSCSHEITLAQYPQFDEIVCVDLAKNRLEEAKAIAEKKDIHNMTFVCANILDYPFEGTFDIVLFHSSLHHFDNLAQLIPEKIIPILNPGGYLVINEYVGPTRLQHPKHQIDAINQSIQTIPLLLRKRFKTDWIKNKYSGSGLIRMLLADPSECIDSSSILPCIHLHFEICIEKPYGGNLLMHVLKDIAHHFIEMDEEKEKVLRQLFDMEDQYLMTRSSDFIFGIYQLKTA